MDSRASQSGVGMTLDVALAIAGIVITVVLGVGALLASKTVRSRRSNQVQKIAKGGIAIQSGRDTNIK
jgi:hypothetical protein